MFRLCRCGSAGVILWALFGSGPSGQTLSPAHLQREGESVREVIRASIGAGGISAPGRPAAGEQQQLAALYGPASYRPLWLDGSGRATPDARDAIALLEGAATEGLDPADYRVATGRAGAADPACPAEAAAFDIALSRNTLRYLEHLRFGRVDPRDMGFDMPHRARLDVTEVLRSALAVHDIGAAAAALIPPIPHYRDLRVALAQYRALAASSALDIAPPRAPVQPGDRSDFVPRLARFLEAVGDVPPGVSRRADSTVYDAMLVEGVKRFQVRHGLAPDGVVGAATGKALAVPLPGRVRQIELAMERMRWLPQIEQDRFIIVNVPMFRAWGVTRVPAASAPFTTEVIVGRALNTRTPVLVEQMEYAIFRPYWNVPSSILRHEILPALRRTPDYLQRHAMEIVAGDSDSAHALPITDSTLERLREGGLRVRQRPGPQNSLGLVKFVFPNDENVYMHGTPAQELFARARRDFSHGCIRVADPVGLSEWVLAREPEWTRDRILATMNADQSARVVLSRPIPVIVFYVTAIVTPTDGLLYFADDIYGHDARLDRSLAQRRAS